jgi:hypothetical protein
MKIVKKYNEGFKHDALQVHLFSPPKIKITRLEGEFFIFGSVKFEG